MTIFLELLHIISIWPSMTFAPQLQLINLRKQNMRDSQWQPCKHYIILSFLFLIEMHWRWLRGPSLCLQVDPRQTKKKLSFIFYNFCISTPIAKLESTICVFHNANPVLVRDYPKLLDDGGEIHKSQEKGWWFDSQLWNLLCTWKNTC